MPLVVKSMVVNGTAYGFLIVFYEITFGNYFSQELFSPSHAILKLRQ